MPRILIKMLVQSSLVLSFILCLTVVHSCDDDQFAGCGVTKGCYRVPDQCTEDCTYFLTWRVSEDTIAFSFVSRLNSGMGWSGFSVNDRRKMSGGSVVDCIVMPHDPKSIVIQMSYNDGKDNDPLDNHYLGLVNGSLSGRLVDSKLECNFTRVKVVDPKEKEHDKVLDLTEPYYVIVGQGPVRNDGTKKRHKHNPHVSSSRITFMEHANYGAARSQYIIAHACLMIIAWMLFASIGIVSARYMKSDWSSKEVCHKALWFQIHRISMVLTVCLVVAALVIILDASQWQFLPPRIHPLLGFIAIGLLLINPIVAVIRPEPNHRFRCLFRLVHGAIGHGSHLVAVFATFFGTRECTAYMPVWAQWVTAGFCGWRLLADVILSFTTSLGNDLSRPVSALNHSTQNLLHDDAHFSRAPEWIASLRKAVVLVYFVGSLCVTIALLYAINSPVGIVDCC